jgi:tripartite-type tricarboxylate transporter receptor subunit TctC
MEQQPHYAGGTREEEETMRVQAPHTLAAALAAVFVATAPAAAQTQARDKYPVKPVRLIVPFTAGSASDLLARRVALKMTDGWSQQIVIDNRGGGGGTLGSQIVVNAAPDGYTLLVHSIAFAMNAALYTSLPYDPLRDFTPVSQIVASTSLLLVSPKLGVKSVKDLIALAKQKPGQLNFGSSGVGSGTHLNSEMFRSASGIDVVHVPYKGVPEVLVDTITGRIHYFLSPLVPALPFLKDGRLLPLAVSTARRSQVLPDVPTIAETLPGYEFQGWFGVFAPARTPRPVVDQISREIARIVELPDVKKQFLAQGEEGKGSTPEEFSRFVRSEVERYRKVVKLAGIRVE